VEPEAEEQVGRKELEVGIAATACWCFRQTRLFQCRWRCSGGGGNQQNDARWAVGRPEPAGQEHSLGMPLGGWNQVWWWCRQVRWAGSRQVQLEQVITGHQEEALRKNLSDACSHAFIWYSREKALS